MEEYKIILEEIRKLQDQIADTNYAVEKLQERVQDLTIKFENVQTEVTETRKAVNSSSERIKNKVSDVVEPVIGSVDNLSAQIKKSKMTVLEEKGKTLWQRIKEKIK